MEIRLENLHAVYGAASILNGVSLTIPAGQTATVIGRSGSGKTTLLKMLNGLLRPSEGRVSLDGQPLDYRRIGNVRRRIGHVMQEAGLFPHLTIEANVTLMARIDRWEGTRIRARLRELLRLVNLEDEGLLQRPPRELSGGQRQRAAIARALFLDPPILLMDEPFAHLDPLTGKELIEEFLQIKARMKKTVVLVTHDFGVACRLADRILLLAGGKIEQDAAPADFVSSPRSALAKSFIETIPSLPSR